MCCELLQSCVQFSLEAIVNKSPAPSRIPLKNLFPFSLQVLQFEGIPINPNAEWREEELTPVSATLNVFGQKFTSKPIRQKDLGDNAVSSPANLRLTVNLLLKS